MENKPSYIVVRASSIFGNNKECLTSFKAHIVL